MEKLRMYMMFNLSIYDAWTDEERKVHSIYKNGKKADKEHLRRQYIETLEKFTGQRIIEESKLYQKDKTPKLYKLIAGFENEAVRLCDSFRTFLFDKKDNNKRPLVTEFIILDCDNEIMRNQIIDNGIMVNGIEYFVYSSSANQQKKKQVLLMSRDFYNKNSNKLMCGITVEKINQYEDAKGHRGCNTGKYMAYTSLPFSKSSKTGIPVSIDEVIVLPEFETLVQDNVNYLDMDTQVIERKTMMVPVNHMDGAGIFLPGVLPQSAQIRGGWIKGAVFPFDFRQFIFDKQQEGIIEPGSVIKDVWGSDVTIDYIRDHVKLILNGSQLKMWKYYESWDQYKKAFKENGLELLINNMLHYPETEEPVVQSAYQFYQTIPRQNITEERIERLCQRMVDTIKDYQKNPNKIIEVMGADGLQELDPYCASVKLYPAMANDPYTMSRIKSKVQKIRKMAMSGKPLIQGFYSYICPDLYAACEYWFCGDKNPEGLIPRNHVYNAFYSPKNVEEVCCLRSPHLSDCEHGIRTLIKSKECERWFSGMDTVISTHDLLVKTLQADVDGDETLITPDQMFIDLLDRNKVPLYYEMKKADPMEVNNENIKKCLSCSFENSVIGYISNSLTKHLNKQEEPDLDFVQVLTAYNNFCIDNPKSQFMPTLKAKYQDMFDALKEEKYPWFFKYAKDKKVEACEKYNHKEKSNVNRIVKYIMNQTSSGKLNDKENESVEKFNPQYFQNKEIAVDRKSNLYIDLWTELIRLKRINTNRFNQSIEKLYRNDSTKKSLLGYIPFYCYCNKCLLDIANKYISKEDLDIRNLVASYLLDIEYFQEENLLTNKDILWNCFGDILYENLKRNRSKKEDNEMVPVKRLAYQSRSEREQQIEEEISRLEEKNRAISNVNITENEYSFITSLKCRKGCERDVWLLYLILVLYKRKLEYLKTYSVDSIPEENKKYFRIYKNKRYGNITRASLDQWMDNCSVAAKGLKRLEKAELIRIEKKVRYDKIYPLFISDIGDDKHIRFETTEYNPMIDYFRYNPGERTVKQCEICKKYFIAPEGNYKTCGKVCQRKLELRNKN